MNIGYILSATLFILGIKYMGKAHTARLGNASSALGMFLALIITLVEYPLPNAGLTFIIACLATLAGLWMAVRVPMTAMPEMVALFNGFGGLASVFVGIAEGYNLGQIPLSQFTFAENFSQIATVCTLIIGGITFTGSMIAYGKLSQKIPTGAIVFKGQKACNVTLFTLLLILSCIWLKTNNATSFYIVTLLSLVGGAVFILHIGGGDMPVIISLLNSLSGVAACAAGLIILNKVLIVAGCLVGTSGLILTYIMCKAMNRSLPKVLKGSLGIAKKIQATGPQKEPRAMTVADAYYPLEAAHSVAFVPGYGLAVAQAQHVIKELGQKLMNQGTEVFYAIHPVAGRMPGHMNVLLAEADVDYDQLVELETANERFPNVDIVIVVGANDVVNPAAVENEGSPIYGMPILEVHKAKNVFVLKRGKGKGFSGLENELFTKDNTWMIYGDAKNTLTQLVAEFKNAD